MRAVQAVGIPTVVVLMNGRPLATQWVQDHVPAIDSNRLDANSWNAGLHASPNRLFQGETLGFTLLEDDGVIDGDGGLVREQLDDLYMLFGWYLAILRVI